MDSRLQSTEAKFTLKLRREWHAQPSKRKDEISQSSSELSRIWHGLPLELVNDILFQAASVSKKDAFAFCLVSTSVRRVVLPCLYRNVFLRFPEQVPAFTAPFVPRRAFGVFPPPPPSHKLIVHAPVESLALAIPHKRPSLETQLEHAASAFLSIRNLAISAQLLSGHGYWLRKHRIRPHTVMLYHHGRPCPVHFREPYFGAVRRLYASTLTGFRGSSVLDLPALTHLALVVRPDQSPAFIHGLAQNLREVLAERPALEMVVLSLPTHSAPAQAALLAPWLTCLPRADPRFVMLPFSRGARAEWRDVCEGRRDVFQDAARWREGKAEAEADPEAMWTATLMWVMEMEGEQALKKWVETEWDLDLAQAPGYEHATRSEYTDTALPVW